MQRANPKSVTKETRPTFAEVLHSKFNNYGMESGYTYDECVDDSQKKIQQNDFQRLFDKYPPLLSVDDMNALKDRYIDILRSINVADIQQDDDYKIINNGTAKDKIDSLIRDIASLASAELLDEPDLTVKKVIFTLLKIKPEEQDKFDGYGYALVSSFIGTTMMHLQNLAHEYIQRYNVVNHAVVNYINNKIQGLIEDGMHKPNRNIDLHQVCFIDKAVTYMSEHKAETGVAATATLAFGVFGLFAFFGARALVNSLSPSSPHSYKP